MYRMIFQYRWAAIAFVLLTIASTVQLVGTGEGDGKLSEPQQQVLAQREQLDAATAAQTAQTELPEEEVEAEDEGFSDDADLVIDPEGTEPSPDVETEEPPVKLVEPETDAAAS